MTIMIQASRTIFLLAQTQNYGVLDRLQRADIIHICLKLITDFEDKHLIAKFKQEQKGDNLRAVMLVFYCKLILIEMSHSSLR